MVFFNKKRENHKKIEHLCNFFVDEIVLKEDIKILSLQLVLNTCFEHFKI